MAAGPCCPAQALSTTLWMASTRRPSLKTWVRGVTRVAPLAMMFSAVLWTRMEASKHLSMQTVVVGRHVVPLVTLPMERVLFDKRPPVGAVWALALVTFGAALYAFGDLNVTSPREAASANFRSGGEKGGQTTRAVGMLMCHVMVTACQLVGTKYFITGDPATGGHPDDVVMFVNAAMAPIFALTAASESGTLTYALTEFRDTCITLETWQRLCLCASIPAAASISWVQARTQHLLSATSFMALNNGVKVFSIVGSIYGMGGHPPSSSVAWGGLVATLIGGMAYAKEMSQKAPRLKTRPKAA